MNNEIEVGDFVRTKDGYIAKVIEIDETKESIQYFKNSAYIWFWKYDKQFEGIYGFESKGFNMQELQSINKKCQELGWLE